MRTRKDIENILLLEKQRLLDLIRDGKLKGYSNDGINLIMNDCENCIKNSYEASIIDIGATVNELINAIGMAYEYYKENYNSMSLTQFLSRYVVGIKADEEIDGLKGIEKGQNSTLELLNGTYLGQAQCFKLGIRAEELATMLGDKYDPYNVNHRDNFRKLFNEHYGTEIPTEEEIRIAKKNYQDACYIEHNQPQKDECYVKLMEILRNSGFLKKGGIYHLLATNQEYQAAKARLSGKSL